MLNMKKTDGRKTRMYDEDASHPGAPLLVSSLYFPHKTSVSGVRVHIRKSPHGLMQESASGLLEQWKLCYEVYHLMEPDYSVQSIRATGEQPDSFQLSTVSVLPGIVSNMVTELQ